MVKIFSFIFRYTPVQVSCTAQFPMTAKRALKKFQRLQQPEKRDVATDFPAKWRLRNKRRNSTLMTCHYPVLESTSDWLLSVPREKFASTIQKHYKNLGTVTGHQYGTCALVPLTSFRGETDGVRWGGVGWRREKDARFFRIRLQGINENNSPTIMAIVYILKKSREQQHLISTRRY